MNTLPKGWVETTLGEVTTKIGSGATPAGGEQSYKASGIPLIRSLNVHFDGVRAEGLAFLDETQAAKLSNVIVEAYDVLLNITGASIGRVAVAPSDYAGARVNQHVSIIRLVREALPKYVCKFLASPAAQGVITSENYGVTRQALTKPMIEDFAFPLPPLAEQKRIVAKLDALNAKSTRARTELARIETLVARYKQAVLGKAFSGEMVGLVPAATEKPHALCWDLPSGWGWVALEEVVEIASNLVNPATIPELPHIAPDNIESGTARLLAFKTIREDGVISAKHRFYAGQILYSKIRPYLRKAVIADFDGACSADMYPLSARDVLSARYLLYWLVGEQFTHFAVEHQGRTVLPKINQTALNKTPLPLPPLATQHEIVRRIETAFARIDRLAAEAKRALALLGKLDEAILAEAFRGELVPQDETDEPAERLLARIRAEREAAPKTRRGRRRRA